MYVILLSLILSLPSFVNVIQENLPSIDLAYEFLIERSNENFTIDEIIISKDFNKVESATKNFGINNRIVWLKYEILNDSDTQTMYFSINNTSLDNIEIFLVVDGEVIESQYGGRVVRIEERLIPSKNIVFELNLEKDQPYTLYTRIESINKKVILASLSDLQVVNKLIQKENLFFGIFTGVLFGLMFYNLFLYFSIKDKVYLIYVIHTFLVWLTQSAILGYTQELIWPNEIWINLRSGVMFSSLVSIAGIWFLRVFLHTKVFLPKLDKGFYFIYAVYAFIFINALFISLTLSYQVLLVTQTIVVLYVLLVAVYVWYKGYSPARYYLLAWSFFMMGILWFVMSEMGILPYTVFSAFIMPLGSALEVILLSFALADKINILIKDKDKEQLDKLQIMKENERLIIRQNENLEEKVKKRTEELELTLHNLQNTQTQLVNQEKMASLGQLTAGIAHEINNPINFVSSNIAPLKRDIKELLEMVEVYREKGLVEFSETSKMVIQTKEEEIEFDYLLKEIDQLLRGMEDGAKRTVEIVKGLRLFSRVDEQDVKKVDIHDGLNSTLILLSSSMNGKIKVNRQYGSLPMVECLPGKINQVFMNIITNGIHALLDNLDSNPEPTLILRTSRSDRNIIVEIEDNGPGMPDKVRQRIFEPFFTTKAVGKGTGLGLSIVYTIIENHKGTLEVRSREGKGTNFIITLPIYQLTQQND
ncbi:7TM diverse intracellular signaling domain-containing protein [Aquiflexum sp.]|uniref:sensor histidine kinase n=1 Tax=Aquiflexum sp. TaxID=1872584 RepID=UPI003594113B